MKIPTHENGEPRSPEAIMRDVNNAFEAAVRRDPANWFWFTTAGKSVTKRPHPYLPNPKPASIIPTLTSSPRENNTYAASSPQTLSSSGASIGWADAVMTTPALQRLREAPARCTHHSPPPPRKLANHPAINAVQTFSNRGWPLEYRRRLRVGKFDIGLVLPQLAPFPRWNFGFRIPERHRLCPPLAHCFSTAPLDARPGALAMPQTVSGGNQSPHPVRCCDYGD